MLGLLSVPAQCCGSMPGLGGFLIAAGFVLALIPLSLMIALIPVEITILRRIGMLDAKTYWAYAYCLLAKVAGLAAVSDLFLKSKTPTGWEVEAIYSLVHFTVALIGFIALFKIKLPRAVLTAALISTVIPWPLSALIRALVSHI